MRKKPLIILLIAAICYFLPAVVIGIVYGKYANGLGAWMVFSPMLLIGIIGYLDTNL